MELCVACRETPAVRMGTLALSSARSDHLAVCFYNIQFWPQAATVIKVFAEIATALTPKVTSLLRMQTSMLEGYPLSTDPRIWGSQLILTRVLDKFVVLGSASSL